MTTRKSRSELEVESGNWNVEQSLVVWSALMKPVEKDKMIADIFVGAKASSEAWEILNSMVEDESNERVKEQTTKNFQGLST